MQEKRFETMYEKAFTQAAHLSPVFPDSAKIQMAQMVEAIARGNKNIDEILLTNQSNAVKGGFCAEEYHTETFNLDAILKGNNNRAYTDRYEEWYQHEWNGESLGKNDTPDIIISQDGEVIGTAQSKYNATPEQTAQQMSQVKDNAPKYENVDTLLGASDQIAPTDDVVSVGEHAQAKADALKAKGGDPAEIKAYEQTVEKNADTISDGGSSSSPLTKNEADAMGGGDKTKLQEIENQYQTKSTLKQMGNAAVGAAAMSAVVCGTMNTVKYIQLIREGKVTKEDAALKILGETVAAAADSAIKASANTGLQSLMVRYGSEKAAIEIVARQGLKNMLKTNVVTVGVVCAVDMVKDLVLLGIGDISKEEFFERQGKGVLMTASGVMGASVGSAAVASAASLFGVGVGTIGMTVAGVVGSLSGGLIAGLAMSLAIENGIEKPYRDLVTNTHNLQAAARELNRVSRTVLQGQILFDKYLQANAEMETHLRNQFNRIDQAGSRALNAIDQI